MNKLCGNRYFTNLDSFPHKYGIGKHRNTQMIDWKNSVGYKAKGIYDNEYFEIDIVGYEKTKKNYLTVRFNGKEFDIKTGNFINLKIRNILGLKTKDFKVEIGQIFKDNKRDLVVIDRRYKESNNGRKRKVYKYHCNKCDNEDWIHESSLIQYHNCNVCTKQKITLNNSIWNKARWMVDLGVSEEDAKNNFPRSNKKIGVICPKCGKKKEITINSIYKNKSISCLNCNEGISYPNKFMMSLLNQLNVEYIREYSPDWIKPRLYDFYIPSLDIIIEMHGIQHYEEVGWHKYGGRSLEEEMNNDSEKEKIALYNNISDYIVIDCRNSNMEWIRGNILNSELANIFDLSKIDWASVDKNCATSLKLEICEFKNNNPDMSTNQIGKMFKLSNYTVRKYIKWGNEQNLCFYDKNKELRFGRSKSGKMNGKNVEILQNGISLGVFESCTDLERQSEALFGVKLLQSAISQVCNGKKKSYKGFIFKFS